MKYSKLFFALGLCLITLSFVACSSGGSSDDGPPDVNEIIPTNIVLDIDIVGSDSANPNGDGSGQVNVQVTATNAVRYEIKFGSNDVIQTNSGVSSYTFSEPGTNSFLISAFAYSSTDNSISTFETISVFFSADGTQLIWSDEFNENGSPDSSKWNYNIGAGGWGNGESQYYTDRSDNVIVEDGLLKIIAKKENYMGSEYTSARLLTEGKFDFKYGRVEIRAKLPASQGTWPALWLLGANFSSVGWPQCGEIDIMEQTGWDKNTVLATCHWLNPADSTPASYGLTTSISGATSSFHIYEMEWTDTEIKMLVDDVEYYVIDLNSDLPFDNDFFFIFNVAMGGSLGGSIDPGFTMDTMEIDYVRVYQ
jgi:beta-glucanase (GH16 family)